jgi:hypothetical protein
VPDARPLSLNDLAAANRRHDERLAHKPLVSALAAVGRLLSNRVPNTSTAGSEKLKLLRTDVNNAEEESC